MLEKNAIREIIAPWLEDAGYTTYIEKQFTVKGSGGRRPDIVCGRDDVWSAIEVKRGGIGDIQRSYKILDYACEYCGGALYVSDDGGVNITNFLVATEFSPRGHLFKDEHVTSEEWQKKQSNCYKKVGGYITPLLEWQRSADFVRSIWKTWRARDSMRHLNIGVLLSNINDRETTLDNRSVPKKFVMHYSKRSQRWGQWWKIL